jgi:hypothetical protein
MITLDVEQLVEAIAERVVAKLAHQRTDDSRLTLDTLPPGVARRPIADALARGEIEGACKIGRRWTFTHAALNAWIATRAKAPAVANDPPGDPDVEATLARRGRR